jgi:hypothetical protein
MILIVQNFFSPNRVTEIQAEYSESDEPVEVRSLDTAISMGLTDVNLIIVCSALPNGDLLRLTERYEGVQIETV